MLFQLYMVLVLLTILWLLHCVQDFLYTSLSHSIQQNFSGEGNFTVNLMISDGSHTFAELQWSFFYNLESGQILFTVMIGRLLWW